ncbi:hypothetical protein HYH03_011043 [Edaphochlamys debaryana]|nr:hypothetical protein HYH03_011043 [Edaphochlamys debaryana]|eukprot:KAG2490655.1 hypothetical protein HYH03_011043 [Edaphochlamys debaryana]
MRVGADLPLNLVSNRTYNATPCGSSPRGYRLVGLKGATSNTSDGGLYSVSLAWAAVDATPPPTPPSSCRVLEQGPFGEPAGSNFTWMGNTFTVVSRSSFDGSAFTWNGPVTGIRLRHSLFSSSLARVTTVQVRYGSTWAPPQGEVATDGWAKDLMVPTSSAIANLTAYWGSGTYFGPGLRGLAMGAQRATMPYATFMLPGDVDQADAVRSAETLPCLDSARGFKLASVKGVIATARSGSGTFTFVESLSFVWRAA